jgi:hypothetical protein
MLSNSHTTTTIINNDTSSTCHVQSTTEADPLTGIIMYDTTIHTEIDIPIRLPSVYNGKMRKKKPIFFNRHITKNKYFLGYIRRKL